MNLASLRDNSPRLPWLAVLVLAIIYLLTGTTGHDPWKTEDAIHIGIAHGFLQQGDWLFPHVAGEAWPHTAPLYHWVAALLGQALGGLLAFHDAARLATPLFGALFLFALSGAARSLHGGSAARLAPLLAIGTLGLLLPLHEAQPAVAGLAFSALAYWGGGLILLGQARGALLLGAGLGLAFPAHGLVGLLMVIAVLPAPTFRHDWRSFVLAIAIALPLMALWPLMLAQRSPELWTLWWQNEIAEATLARNLPTLRHLEQLVWAAWPVLPLALWSLWLYRRQPIQLAMPLLGSLLGLAWFLTGSPRLLSVLPMLPPLILLAAAGTDRLRRSAASAFDWFGVMTFSLISGLIWLGASAQALGWPPKVARNFDKLAPGHDVHYSMPALAFAATLTIVWLLLWRLPRASWRGSLHWAAGATLMWVLVATLWMAWIDHGKSYRAVARSLHAALPRNIDCIERSNLGTAQRASLDYFTGLRTVPPTRTQECDWRLVVADRDRVTPAGWTERWHGNRPSDRNERWYLDQRGN